MVILVRWNITKRSGNLLVPDLGANDARKVATQSSKWT